MEDAKIVRLLLDRAEVVLEVLQRKFGKLIYGICLNILQIPQDAQECENDTYLALWNAIPPARPDPLTPYVCRTGRNIALNRLRANTTQKHGQGYTLSLEELAEYIPDDCMEESVSARALGRAIDDFLSRQSRENRILFVRRYWFGDSVAQAGKYLGLTPNAASVRLLRLRQKLKDYLTERELYDE